jgi:hypothetical protein
MQSTESADDFRAWILDFRQTCLAELGLWDELFHEEVHGGKLSLVHELQYLTSGVAMSIGPTFHGQAFAGRVLPRPWKTAVRNIQHNTGVQGHVGRFRFQKRPHYPHNPDAMLRYSLSVNARSVSV